MNIATKMPANTRGQGLFVTMLWALTACASIHDKSGPSDGPGTAGTAVSPCSPDQLATAPMQAVFDGSEGSLHHHWHSWKLDRVTPTWSVENGALHLKPGVAGDELVLNGAYENFALSFHWSVSPGGNSGVKYNIKEASGQPVGFEYQILDDERHPDAQMGRNGNRKTAALYDILPRAPAPLNPANEFNHGCIVFQDKAIEHWLNGVLVLKANIQDQAFIQAVSESKFANHAGFLDTPPAQIFLQAHGEAATFKDITFLAL